jgi:HEAT repeat protein
MFARRAPVDDGLNSRVTVLEETVAQLNKASDYLMDRGQVPLSAARIAEFQQKFLDPNASPRDLLQALNLLQRNNGLNDSIVQHALSLISGSTNGWLRDGLVRELGNTTNTLVRGPMMKLASTDPDTRVRANAVQSLRRFAGDPQVDSLLWQMMRSEQDRRVHDQVAEVLREAPMNAARAADLRKRAIDESSSLDERLIAVSALRRSGQEAGDVTAALAQYVQSTQNPDERARVFSAFDGAAPDPQMMVPLVNGLQDQNATVRARAADALSGYNSDPGVAEWLRYVAQNDTDPRVRREAEEALRDQQQQRERRGGPPGRDEGRRR